VARHELDPRIDREALEARMRDAEARIAGAVYDEMRRIEREFGVVPFLLVGVGRVRATCLTDSFERYLLGQVSARLSVMP
jgi:hypothetical protein